MAQGHKDALIDEDGPDDLLKGLPGLGSKLPAQGLGGHAGELFREHIRPGGLG